MATEINTEKETELDKLAKDFVDVKKKMEKGRKPVDETVDLQTEIDTLEPSIIKLLKKQGVQRLETKDFIFSLRNIPTYFRIISEPQVITSLKRRGLHRFIKKVETVQVKLLKEYLSATDSIIPGLKRIDTDVSLYVYPKNPEKHAEEHEGSIDNELLVFIENIDDYVAKKATNEALADDWRLVCAFWSTFHDPAKTIKFSKEDIINLAQQIYDEIVKRVQVGKMKHTFEPEKMTSLSRKLYGIVSVSSSEGPGPDEVKTQQFREFPQFKPPRIGGIYLVEPHARSIILGKKKMIVKSRAFENMTEKDLFLISGSLCWGIISLDKPVEISIRQFNNRRDSHLITPEEAEEWWNVDEEPDKKLYEFSFEIKRIYAPPKTVEIPAGIQTFVSADSIKFKN